MASTAMRAVAGPHDIPHGPLPVASHAVVPTRAAVPISGWPSRDTGRAQARLPSKTACSATPGRKAPRSLEQDGRDGSVIGLVGEERGADRRHAVGGDGGERGRHLAGHRGEVFDHRLLERVARRPVETDLRRSHPRSALTGAGVHGPAATRTCRRLDVGGVTRRGRARSALPPLSRARPTPRWRPPVGSGAPSRAGTPAMPAASAGSAARASSRNAGDSSGYAWATDAASSRRAARVVRHEQQAVRRAVETAATARSRRAGAATPRTAAPARRRAGAGARPGCAPRLRQRCGRARGASRGPRPRRAAPRPRSRRCRRRSPPPPRAHPPTGRRSAVHAPRRRATARSFLCPRATAGQRRVNAGLRPPQTAVRSLRPGAR